MPFVINFAPSRPRFADLVIGDNDEMQHAVRVFMRGGALVSSFYVWGARGTGKSALLQAAAAEAEENGTAVWQVAARMDSLPAGLPDVAGAGALVVDDADCLTAESEMELLDWLNSSGGGNGNGDGGNGGGSGAKRLLAAGQCAPGQLPLRREVAGRLANGLVFQLRALAAEDTKTALTHYARRRGLHISDEVADVLLDNLPRDVGSLAAALDEMDAFFLTEKKDLSVRRVRAWLATRGSLF